MARSGQLSQLASAVPRLQSEGSLVSVGRGRAARIWLGLAISPAIGYPLFVGLLFFRDLLAGEQVVLGYLRYERHHLWNTFWSDYFAALPVFYLGAAALLLVWLALARFAGARSPGWMAAIAAVVGWVTGTQLSGAWLGWAPVTITVVAAGIGTALALLVARLRSVT